MMDTICPEDDTLTVAISDAQQEADDLRFWIEQAEEMLGKLACAISNAKCVRGILIDTIASA